MANKKSLKHAINLVCDELFAEAVAASLYGNDPQRENSNAVLFSIIKLRRNYISRVSHAEPGMKPKAYFQDLRVQFAKEVDEVVDHINNQ